MTRPAIPDLLRRLAWTLALLFVFRVGCNLPLPGVDPAALLRLAEPVAADPAAGLLNALTGNSLERAAVLAVGIVPYVKATFILWGLTVIFPSLGWSAGSAEGRRRRLGRYTLWLTLGIAPFEALTVALKLERLATPSGRPLVPEPGWGFLTVAVLVLTLGAACVVWLAGQITRRGLGNGVMTIVVAGVVVALPPTLIDAVRAVSTGQRSALIAGSFAVSLILLVALIVTLEKARRRLPVAHARRVKAGEPPGDQSSEISFSVSPGTMPVLYTSTILTLPASLGAMGVLGVGRARFFTDHFQWGDPLHYMFYLSAIFFFSYFHLFVIFNPVNVAEGLHRRGAFIPGLRSGRETAEFLDQVRIRLTFVGTSYVAAMCIVPEFLTAGFRLDRFPGAGDAYQRMPDWFLYGIGIDLEFGGLLLLIVTGFVTGSYGEIKRHWERRGEEDPEELDDEALSEMELDDLPRLSD